MARKSHRLKERGRRSGHRRVARALTRGRPLQVVCGVALNLHGIVHATEDLDIFVDPVAENVEKLKAALKSVYADPHLDEISAEDLAGEYPAIQPSRSRRRECSIA